MLMFRFKFMKFIFAFVILCFISCKNNEKPNEKPVLYFYPESEQNINVSFKNLDNLIFTYPKLENSWNFKANPEGKLTFENKKEYNYLFWEGKSDVKDFNIKEGFVVENENLTAFFEEKLIQLGLKPHEYNDFIVYWVPKMQIYPQTLIHFAINHGLYSNEIGKNLDNQFAVKISPKPETFFRLTMLFQPCSKNYSINEQKLPKLERKGFTVVEWGGIELESENI